MENGTLIIIRGLPGSGKSTFGKRLTEKVRSADDFFLVEGKYVFDAKKISLAHKWCQEKVMGDLSEGFAVVANTFTQGWEFQPYVEMTKQIIVVDLFDGGMSDSLLEKRNVHGVSRETIAHMRNRWEADWRNADPRPPWLRK